MDSPEKVYQLYAVLGYKTLDPSHKGKEAWGLKEKDKDSAQVLYDIPEDDKFIKCKVASKAEIIIKGDEVLKNG